jgi:porin
MDFTRTLSMRTMPPALLTCLCLAGAAAGGQEPNAPAPAANWLEALGTRESLTDGFGGAAKTLEDQGIHWCLAATQIYQVNLHGGQATHRRAGRYAGSYDLDLEFDLEKIAALRGGKFFMSIEGSWSDGLDTSSVGSFFGVNDDAGGDEAVMLSEAWYEQSWLDGRVLLRVGKVDLTGTVLCHNCPVAFDGSMYANNETAQFLNGALVNNPTIPFPDNGLGMMLHTEPLEGFYMSAGVADAQGDARETGFRTTFHGPDNFFGIFETGVTPRLGGMDGAYRVGCWYDPQPKDRLTHGVKRDDMGMYLSFDQMVFKEVKDDPNDSQGLGFFARWGYAHSDVAEITHFWSAGGQYRGLLPGRDDDVLGVGVAQGVLSDYVPPAGRETNETAIEAYYNARVCPWLNITGDVQYIIHPGADSSVDNAVVIGIRVQMNF